MRYQSNRPKRQFLAGVTCPKCQAMDAVVQVQIFEPKFDEYIECNDCGHSEHRPQADDLKNNISNTINIKNKTDIHVLANKHTKNQPIIVNAGIAVENISDQPSKK